MYEVLKNGNLFKFVPIIISTISLIYVIMKYNRNKNYENWVKNFENYKEVERQNGVLIQNQLSEQNIRASLIPYFNLVLNNSRIKKEGDSLILEIGLINIGKESGSNIELSSEYEGRGIGDGILIKEEYDIYKNLSKNFAISGEEVTFEIKSKYKYKDIEKIDHYLKFKINYSDIIGNVYEQEFLFKFYELENLGNNVYDFIIDAYKPKLIKKMEN